MEPEPRKLPVRFYEIDLLRFLAAVSVVLFHYTFRGYEEGHFNPIAFPELGQVTKYGYLGVELFFIISGYVVLLSAQGKTVRQFFLSRVTRLYPAFWAACTLTYVVKRIWGPGPVDTQMSVHLHAGLMQYPYNMTMLFDFLGITPMDGAYWSLTVELTFYFLIAILIAFKLMPRLDWVLAGWLGYAALPGLAHTGTLFSALLFPEYAPYFAAGMVFYLLQQPNGRTPFRYGLLLAAYLLALRFSAAQALANGATYHTQMSAGIVSAAVSLIFVIFLLIVFKKINYSRFSWFAWLGALTYPLYLIHGDIGFIIFHRMGHLLNKHVLLGAILGTMVGASYLIHVLVEKRLSKPLGTQVNKWLTQIASPA